MRRTLTIRQSLLRSMVVVILLLGGAILATTFFGSRRAVETMSRSVMSQTVQNTEAELLRFFSPVLEGLRLARAWGSAGLLDFEKPEVMNRLFLPILEQYPQIAAILVADGRGRGYMLARSADGWRLRLTRREEWGTRNQVSEWSAGGPEPQPSWSDLDYDPRTRPWYQGALSVSLSAADAGQYPSEAWVHWTEPYEFWGSGDPGITASALYDAGDGVDHVVGFDVLLHDITQFTATLRVSEYGRVAVLTEDRLLIGLPAEPQFSDPATWDDALLRRPRELGIPLYEDAAQAFAARSEATLSDPVSFFSSGQRWWGQAKSFRLAPQRDFAIGVIVPDTDIFGERNQIRLWVLLITLLVLAIAVGRASFVARGLSQPIESLVEESERIRQGDFDAGEAIDSELLEVQQLADAHERMRLGLQSLMKLERDLQLARQIQQNTFPKQVPQVDGYDLVAWSEPADETGGDTFDVIGGTERAVLLLADATGHGIGPALVATQSRSMLRMAVRMHETLPEIVRHMNEQLCDDLPGNRFVTAWLGELNGSDHSLTSFSAGQAPLLHFSAADGSIRSLNADAPPMGMFPRLPVSTPTLIQMKPGDIFAVISDGIFEAADPSGEELGKDRVMQILSRHAAASTSEILVALQSAVREFTQGLPANDDRTVILIKRVGR